MKKALFIFVFISITTFTFSTDYYISSINGHDNNSGTSPSSAWKTIEKVLREADQGRFANGGDRLLFERGGIYYGSIGRENIRCDYFGAYGEGAQPIFTGLISVNEWVEIETNIWKSSLTFSNNDIRILTKNGVSQPLGRFPNEEWNYYEIGSGANLIVDFGSNYADDYWTGGECVIKSSRWTIDVLKISAQKGDSILTSEPSTYPLDNGWGYFIQNHPNTLDLDGEWCYFDNHLYVYSTTNPNSDVYEYSHHQTGIFSLRNEYEIASISFEGYNAYGINGNLGSFNIYNCEFNNIGGSAIEVEYADYLIIKNNQINNILNNGIRYIDCFNTQVTGNTMEEIAMIEGRGRTGNNTYSGILQLRGGNHLIDSNKLNKIGYNGISFFQADGVRVLNNVVHYTCLIKDDGGGIYSWTKGDTSNRDRGHLIRGNIISNCIGNNDGVHSSLVDYMAAYAIYIDDRKVDINIEDNIIFDSEYGIFIHHSQDINLTNNIIYNCNNGMLFRQYGGLPIYDCDVTGNTFVNTNDEASENHYYTMRLDAVSPETYIPANNIFDNNYYINPFLFDYYIYTFNGTDLIGKDLILWQTIDNQGVSSQTEPLKWSNDINVDKADFLLFDYAEDTAKQVKLLGDFIDINGNPVTGEVTIAPYSHLLLLKASNGSLNHNLQIQGSNAVCYNENTTTLHNITTGGFSDYGWNIVPHNAGVLTKSDNTLTIEWEGNELPDTIIVYLYGCNNSTCNQVSAPFYIGFTEEPVANFEYTQNKNTVAFSNFSENSTEYYWNFGDNSTSRNKNPLHYYPYTGNFEVVLTSANEACARTYTDSISIQYISLIDNLNSVLTNGFSPNDDGINDYWDLANIFIEYPNTTLKIFNRRNHLVRIIGPEDAYWIGDDFDGQKLPKGNYKYILETNDNTNETRKGFVSIVY